MESIHLQKQKSDLQNAHSCERWFCSLSRGWHVITRTIRISLCLGVLLWTPLQIRSDSLKKFTSLSFCPAAFPGIPWGVDPSTVDNTTSSTHGCQRFCSLTFSRPSVSVRPLSLVSLPGSIHPHLQEGLVVADVFLCPALLPAERRSTHTCAWMNAMCECDIQWLLLLPLHNRQLWHEGPGMRGAFLCQHLCLTKDTECMFHQYFSRCKLCGFSIAVRRTRDRNRIPISRQMHTVWNFNCSWLESGAFNSQKEQRS